MPGRSSDTLLSLLAVWGTHCVFGQCLVNAVILVRTEEGILSCIPFYLLTGVFRFLIPRIPAIFIVHFKHRVILTQSASNCNVDGCEFY